MRDQRQSFKFALSRNLLPQPHLRNGFLPNSANEIALNEESKKKVEGRTQIMVACTNFGTENSVS